MFNAKDYYDLTPNSRRAIAKLSGFYCPADCKRCPFYCDDVIAVNYDVFTCSLGKGKTETHTHEGHCIVNSARVEFPDWSYEPDWRYE